MDRLLSPNQVLRWVLQKYSTRIGNLLATIENEPKGTRPRKAKRQELWWLRVKAKLLKQAMVPLGQGEASVVRFEDARLQQGPDAACITHDGFSIAVHYGMHGWACDALPSGLSNRARLRYNRARRLFATRDEAADRAATIGAIVWIEKREPTEEELCLLGGMTPMPYPKEARSAGNPSATSSD